MAKRRQIFTREDFQKLNEADRKLSDVLPMLDDAEACGVPCQEARQIIGQLQERFAEIRTRFMTPAPKK